jgi:hypothetical protein
MEFDHAFSLLDTNASVTWRLSGGDGSPNRVAEQPDSAVPVMTPADNRFLLFVAIASETGRRGST